MGIDVFLGVGDPALQPQRRARASPRLSGAPGSAAAPPAGRPPGYARVLVSAGGSSAMVECACYTGARGEALIGDPESPTTLARLSCAIRMQGYRCWEGEPQIWVRGGLRDGTDLAVALAYLAACGQRECPPRCPAGSLGLSGVVEDGPMAGLGLREAAYLLALQPSPRTDIQLARLSPRRVGGGPLFISPLASTGRR